MYPQYTAEQQHEKGEGERVGALDKARERAQRNAAARGRIQEGEGKADAGDRQHRPCAKAFQQGEKGADHAVVDHGGAHVSAHCIKCSHQRQKGGGDALDRVKIALQLQKGVALQREEQHGKRKCGAKGERTRNTAPILGAECAKK